jgi:NitT/TauT family transport system substrate-binding protein
MRSIGLMSTIRPSVSFVPASAGDVANVADRRAGFDGQRRPLRFEVLDHRDRVQVRETSAVRIHDNPCRDSGRGAASLGVAWRRNSGAMPDKSACKRAANGIDCGVPTFRFVRQEPLMRALSRFAVLAAALAWPATALAQMPDKPIGIGISGWTGFAPLTLAKETGIFKKNGLDVVIKKIPQKDRHLAILSNDIQCAATTVETWIVWNANGVATKQIFQLDKSYGADGMAVKPSIASIKDIKGKTVAASAPGTAPYFTLAWMLKKNGLSLKDVTVSNLEPAAAAQALIAGQIDVAMTYEPFLSTVRAAPDKGKIIATTLDYPMIMDTFGCTPDFLTKFPAAAKALAQSYFEALEMIGKETDKANQIMGADVKQTAEQFANSSKYLRWQDREANTKFFSGELQAFSKEAAELLLEVGIIKKIPAIDDLYDASFVK